MDSSPVLKKGDITTNSVQLIDEEKRFAKNLETYVDACYMNKSEDDSGLNYHIVSVFGSQSTGKSTLLNKLFGTQFDVMDEEKRQQTTKGIWFSHANYIASHDETNLKTENKKNVYVLDVEGVDGREKADDKDFERKSALFALATSEVLIVNIFEHQVGLYQGANMELLKTVMEVNLSLFHKQAERCLLLFVIRDFTGLTPLSNLGQSLEADMNRIWADLNKPEECKDSKLVDFFDLKFASISHKHYQPEKFDSDIRKLGDDFSNETFFANNRYHKKIPIDAWALYSQQIWEQIENNKDLDLPTQQILVSRFKCNEISTALYDEIFDKEFNELTLPEKDPLESCKVLKALRSKCLELYDQQASRYKSAVYLETRKELELKMDLKLKDFQSRILGLLIEKLVTELDSAYAALKKSKTTSNFEETLKYVIDETLDKFETASSQYILVDDSEVSEIYAQNLKVHSELLMAKLKDFSDRMRNKESTALVNKLGKKFQIKIKEYLIEEVTQPTDDLWDKVMSQFDQIVEKLLKTYEYGQGYDFQLGLKEGNDLLHLKIMKMIWKKYDVLVHDFINEDTVSRILRNVFEDKFKFDDKGLPIVWKDFNQLDSRFNKSKEETLKLLPLLGTMRLSNGKTVQIPKYNIDENDSEQELDSASEIEDDSDPDINTNKFARLLTTKQKAKISKRFKKDADAIYLDAKRLIAANRTSIPPFMYVLLLVLGWNEFMMILRNPILFVLSIILLTGFYFAYNMQMVGPILTITNSVLNQSKTVIKDKLKDFLLDEPEKQASQSPQSEQKPTETYELDDL
ncbi:Protein SEY1 [Pichia kudriavzevii]|uniref:Protein SEY1 n=1 Tax=Pichia kudriavzevii TaxID=4909 RepID=A0A1V2LJJ0_PICKU|nr:Protein SEY1 [Pichia kudriavzevii]